MASVTGEIRLRFDFEGRTLRFEAPARVITAHSAADVAPALDAADAAARAGCWVAGYVAYEAAAGLDAALRTRAPTAGPLVWFGVFRAPAPPPADSGVAAVARRAVVTAGSATVPAAPASCGPATLTADVPRAAYDAAIDTIRAAIGRGDVYQVNYTMRLRGVVEPGALDYEALRRAQAAAYCAELTIGGRRIVSLSPELFMRRAGRTIVTRPMKGTARRGRWLEEDDAAAAALAVSEKDRAENLMIVDLMRNDLGRIARFGTVRVPRLFEIERYPTLHQLTSTVAATLREEVGLLDMFRALFPCGSVTGAPKVAAMQAIAALESAPRGVYCGAIGFLEPGGDCTFNVAIRTVSFDIGAGRAEYGVGGGITWDSSAPGEHDEALAKAAVLTVTRPHFELVETMRLEAGRFARLDAHLARLAASAQYFDFVLDMARVRAALAAEAHARPGCWRVRLLLDRAGAVSLSSTPLGAAEVAEPHPALPAVPAAPALGAALAASCVASTDVWLYHKTTHRAVYEARRAACPDAAEVLLRNERGELTEFTTGNLVVELGGVRCTPPRDAGLLAGVYRDMLLQRRELVERTLRPIDLERATGCWLINSVRGWVPVHVRPAARVAPDAAAAPGSHGAAAGRVEQLLT